MAPNEEGCKDRGNHSFCITGKQSRVSKLWEVEIAYTNRLMGDSETMLQRAELEDILLTKAPTDEDLQWYFGNYIAQPILQTTRAAKIASQIKSYGEQLFNSLFPCDSPCHRQLDLILRGNVDTSQLEICIEGPPKFQKLTWESMSGPEGVVPLSLRSQFWRRVIMNDQPQNPSPLISAFSSNQIKVLLVTARTRGKSDIGYRTISRLLVDSLDSHRSRYELTILRPGTLKALRDELERRGPGYYQVVHFDTHGLVLDAVTYSQLTAMSCVRCSEDVSFGNSTLIPFLELQSERSFYKGQKRASKDFVAATTLIPILRKHFVQVAILNACDSASASASLASELHNSGIPHVLGISHAMTEDAAVLMINSFYGALVNGSSFAAAGSIARNALFEQQKRLAFYDSSIELQDWILPIVYQDWDRKVQLKAIDTSLSRCVMSSNTIASQETVLTPLAHHKYARTLNSHRLLGRDYDILQIEQILVKESNALLLNGLGGIGKSALIQHLCSWWVQTSFCEASMYYEFASHVWTLQELVADIGQQVFHDDLSFQIKPLAQQIKLVLKVAQSRRFAFGFDNLESISDPLEGQGAWTLDQKRKFRKFIAGLKDSSCYVLLGSRGEEKWLSAEVFEDNVLMLGGLDDQAASSLIQITLQSFGKLEYLTESNLATLKCIAELLDRHPLALQTVLSATRESTPTEILQDLQSDGIKLEAQDDLDRCISYSFRSLHPDLKSKLYELSPWSTHVILKDLELYSEILSRLSVLDRTETEAKAPVTWKLALEQLQKAGLAAAIQGHENYFVLHPHMIRYLHKMMASGDGSRDFKLHNSNEALRLCARERSQPFADNLDIAAPHPVLKSLLDTFDFALENYRLALVQEVHRMNHGETSKPLMPPLIWTLILAYFNQSGKYRESLEFSEAILNIISHENESTVVFHSEILNHVSQVHQNLQDRPAALEALKKQLRLLTSQSTPLKVRRKPDSDQILEQKVADGYMWLALTRSKCYEQLCNLAMTNGQLRLGIKCQYASIGWRRTAGLERSTLRSLEQIPIQFLSKLFSVRKDVDNEDLYRRASVIRAIEVGMFQEVVNQLVVSRKVSEFTDNELPVIEELLCATKKLCLRGPSDFDLPSIEMFLLDLAVRQGDKKKVVAQAELAIKFLRRFPDDMRETTLYMKLGEWYESEGDPDEALACFVKAYANAESKLDLGGLVISEKILTAIIRVQEALDRKTEVSHYAIILRDLLARSETIAKIETGEERDDTSGAIVYQDTRDSDFWDELSEKVENHLAVLEPTLANFAEELRADGKKLDASMANRKELLGVLYLRISSIIDHLGT